MRKLVKTAASAAAAMLVIQASAGTWHDDFEGGGLDDWVIFASPEVAEWEERRVDGNGVVTGEIRGDFSISVLQLRPDNVDTNKWTNYKVQARARMDSEIQDGELAIFGFSLYDHWDDITNLYCFARVQQGRQEVRFYNPQDFGVFWLRKEFEDETWYDISAEVKTNAETGRDTISFTIDDDDPLIVEWPGSIGFGGVGLAIGRGQFSFDDLTITGDSIPTGGEGPLSVSPAGKAAQVWANLKK